MKTNTLKAAAAVGLSALLVGGAAAQESKSKPVGYETITIPNGFSYAGLRLHEAPAAAGELGADPAGAVVSVPDGIADALTNGTAYLFEVDTGDAAGAVVEVVSFDSDADTVTLSDDLSANLVSGDTFTIRPTATLASVFGESNSAGLDAGETGPGGADVIWVPDGSGGFNKYYYDDLNATTFAPSWSNADDGSVVDPASVQIVYTDGLVILGDGVDNNTFVVSGSVKLTQTSYVFQSGFNYLGTVFPAGSTLASAFGIMNESGLAAGETGPGGADVIYVPAGDDFDRYYFDDLNATTFAPTWSDAADGGVVDANTVSFDGASGIIVLHEGDVATNTIQAPSFYSEL